MNRFTLTAFAAFAMTGAAYAQPSQTCLTETIFGTPFQNGPQCFVAQTMNPGTGGAPVRVAAPAAPVVVAPADLVDPVDPPTSVPATPVTPMPGIITGNIADTQYAGAAPGFYENVSFNGGFYDAIVEADGSYIARPVD